MYCVRFLCRTGDRWETSFEWECPATYIRERYHDGFCRFHEAVAIFQLEATSAPPVACSDEVNSVGSRTGLRKWRTR